MAHLFSRTGRRVSPFWADRGRTSNCAGDAAPWILRVPHGLMTTGTLIVVFGIWYGRICVGPSGRIAHTGVFIVRQNIAVVMVVINHGSVCQKMRIASLDLLQTDELVPPSTRLLAHELCRID